MRVAHIGPPPARLGGPAGYLFELQRAAAGRETRGHEVRFPPPLPPAPPAAPASPLKRARAWAGRWKRRVLGPPQLYRPPLAELRQAGGRLDRMLAETAERVVAEAAASLTVAARNEPAEALFAHDSFVAEHLLAQLSKPRQQGPRQRVWLLAHTPLPAALYLAWSWAVPECDWREVLEFPDVQTWIERELAVWSRVDCLVLPCREAGDELVRVDPRFAFPLERAEHLLSGAAGPPAGAAPSRERWRLPEGVPVALFLGTAQPYRGLDALLAALQHLPAGVAGVVAVAGPAPESLPRHPRLKPLGRVADVSGLLATVDFVVNVNRFSLLDLSTIEALEAGRPLLLHATGGNRTFRDLGAGCAMLDDLAPATVARGLAEMFALPQERLRQMALASRACYDARLTPERLWRRHLDLYDRSSSCG
jgi:glycosyltransferase involved in cell wall biosynthesis